MIQQLGTRDKLQLAGLVLVAAAILGLAVQNGAEGGALALRAAYVITLLTAALGLLLWNATGRTGRALHYFPILNNTLLLLMFPAAWTTIGSRLTEARTGDLIFLCLYVGALLLMIALGLAQARRPARGAGLRDL